MSSNIYHFSSDFIVFQNQAKQAAEQLKKLQKRFNEICVINSKKIPELYSPPKNIESLISAKLDSIRIAQASSDKIRNIMPKPLDINKYLFENLNIQIDLQEQIATALKSTLPYLPDEKQEIVKKAIAAENTSKINKKFSLEDLYKFFYLLLTLLPILLSLTPDPQLERLIELKETEIAIETQTLELTDQRFDDLQNTIQTMSETICILSDEIDALSEQVQ